MFLLVLSACVMLPDKAVCLCLFCLFAPYSRALALSRFLLFACGYCVCVLCGRKLSAVIVAGFATFALFVLLPVARCRPEAGVGFSLQVEGIGVVFATYMAWTLVAYYIGLG